MKSYHAAKLKLDISKQELMSMKVSEVIVTFSLSVAKHRRVAAGKNLVHGYAFSFLRERNQSCFSGIGFLRAR